MVSRCSRYTLHQVLEHIFEEGSETEKESTADEEEEEGTE